MSSRGVAVSRAMVRRCVKRCAGAGGLARMILSYGRQVASCCARTHCRATAYMCRRSCVGSQLGQTIVCPAANRTRTTHVFRMACTRCHARARKARGKPWPPLDRVVRAQAMPWSRQLPTSSAWCNRQRQRGACSTEMLSVAEARRSLQGLTPGPRLLSQQTQRFRTADASPAARPPGPEASDGDTAQELVAADEGGRPWSKARGAWLV